MPGADGRPVCTRYAGEMSEGQRGHRPLRKARGTRERSDSRGCPGRTGNLSPTPTMIPLISQHSDELAELCRRHHVKRLEVFGSAAVENFNPDTSDIDFLVAFQPLPAGGKADFALLEDLKRLFDRSVDLVVDRAIENPYFRQNVDKSKVAVYES